MEQNEVYHTTNGVIIYLRSEYAGKWQYPAFSTKQKLFYAGMPSIKNAPKSFWNKEFFMKNKGKFLFIPSHAEMENFCIKSNSIIICPQEYCELTPQLLELKYNSVGYSCIVAKIGFIERLDTITVELPFDPTATTIEVYGYTFAIPEDVLEKIKYYNSVKDKKSTEIISKKITRVETELGERIIEDLTVLERKYVLREDFSAEEVATEKMLYNNSVTETILYKKVYGTPYRRITIADKEIIDEDGDFCGREIVVYDETVQGVIAEPIVDGLSSKKLGEHVANRRIIEQLGNFSQEKYEEVFQRYYNIFSGTGIEVKKIRI